MPDDRIGKTCLVSSAVTNFEHQGIACNLRALTAVDSASIVLDAAKGLESSLAGSLRGLPVARRAGQLSSPNSAAMAAIRRINIEYITIILFAYDRVTELIRCNGSRRPRAVGPRLRTGGVCS